MKFKFISPEGPEYLAERMLRWEVLHKPLGLPPGSEVQPEEEKSLHLIALERKRVVGCICFHPESTKLGRIFAMAVSEEYQGKGFGRQLLHQLESLLSKNGICDVYLYARQDVEGFYSRLGYQPEGEWLEWKGFKHRLMKKAIRDNL